VRGAPLGTRKRAKFGGAMATARELSVGKALSARDAERRVRPSRADGTTPSDARGPRAPTRQRRATRGA